eukprot:TRINITY_DN30611_c1_g1_i1.p1 TRINITY_DN30611_c1_g1~~TRINITY_DN30611_c1_g1_i1.p1  ORF type:complete len:258 (-),score=30.97 TRINITY_DN30611_c1_g1_i1:421-1194(-)
MIHPFLKNLSHFSDLQRYLPNGSMVSDSNQIFYACISRETTVIADFSYGDSELEALAQQCLEKTPQFHLQSSHTIKRRIYCFSMDDPFVYFAILDEGFGKAQGFRFLDRLKASFESFLKRQSTAVTDQLSSRCLQEELSPVFRFLMHLSEEGDEFQSPDVSVGKNSQGSEVPLIGNGKKDVLNGEEIGEVSGENLFSDRCLTLKKNAFSVDDDDELHEAQRMWWQLVWMILFVDIVFCCVLLGVWLMICKGFQCMRQ